MADIEAIKQAAERDLQRRIEGEFFDFLRIPTISHPELGSHDEVVRGAEYLRGMMEQRGIAVEIVPNDPHPFVVGRLIRDPSLPTVLHYCHFDVQPAVVDDKGTVKWASNPFQPVMLAESVLLFDGRSVQDHRIYARGSVDDKGPLMTHLWALDGYRTTNTPLPVNLIYIFEGTEEVGDKGGLEAYIRDHRDDLKPTAVTMFDSIAHETGAPFICTSLRGIVKGKVTITTGENVLHSGIHSGNVVPNPLRLAAKLYAMLDDERDFVYEGVPNVDPDVSGLRFDSDEYRATTGVRYLRSDIDLDTPYLARFWHRPTLELHAIEPEMKGTMIPPYATFDVSMRIVVGQDPQRIADGFRRQVQEIADKLQIPAECINIETRVGLPAFKQEDDAVLVTMGDALRAGYGTGDTLHYVGGGGSIPQAWAFKTYLGCPVIVTGIAEPRSNYHATQENVLVKHGLIAGIRTNIEFYERLAQQQRQAQ